MTDQLIFDVPLSLVGVIPGTTALTGTVDVDYGTPNTVSGSLSLTAVGAIAAQTYTELSLSQTGTSGGEPVYTLTGTNGLTNISIQYTGTLPSDASGTVSSLVSIPLASGTGAISSNVVCFVAGTLIRTPRGDVPIEELSIGDLVVTIDGVERAIKWLGHSIINCARYANKRAAMPVRIAAGAFGPGKPERDLFVSPGHGICISVVEEVLIHASALVNGSTITQIEADEVDYWHVELESHNILLANGLPVESYLDTGNRTFFARESASLAPCRDALRAAYCRPLVREELLVRAVRSRLRQRAPGLGWHLGPPQLSDVQILVDGVPIEPDIVDDLSLRFVLPATDADVCLLSSVAVPAEVSDSSDRRTLGLCIRQFIIEDGWKVRRQISSDDARLSCGFHAPEGTGDEVRRWTDGRAILPAVLWENCRGHFFLRVELFCNPLPRWAAPAHQINAAAEPFGQSRLLPHLAA